MRRQLRMTAFHIRQFVSVPYFVQVMAVTAAITALVQYLAVRAWGAVTPAQGWTRAGVIGLWSTATCAAGIIGFERHKGTLVHLVMARWGPCARSRRWSRPPPPSGWPPSPWPG